MLQKKNSKHHLCRGGYLHPHPASVVKPPTGSCHPHKSLGVEEGLWWEMWEELQYYQLFYFFCGLSSFSSLEDNNNNNTDE